MSRYHYYSIHCDAEWCDAISNGPDPAGDALEEGWHLDPDRSDYCPEHRPEGGQ